MAEVLVTRLHTHKKTLATFATNKHLKSTNTAGAQDQEQYSTHTKISFQDVDELVIFSWEHQDDVAQRFSLMSCVLVATWFNHISQCLESFLDPCWLQTFVTSQMGKATPLMQLYNFLDHMISLVEVRKSILGQQCFSKQAFRCGCLKDVQQINGR